MGQVSKQYYIYIMTNKTNRVLYTGVTNDLKKIVYEHKEKLVEGFTKKYNIGKLVYYEVCEDVGSAILREEMWKERNMKQSDEKKARIGCFVILAVIGLAILIGIIVFAVGIEWPDYRW